MRLSSLSANQPCQDCGPRQPEAVRGQDRRIRPVNHETVRASSKLEFQVRTAEGDTVTLSLRQSEGASVKGSRSRYENKFQASVAVEGSLSDQELQDIQRVLESFSKGETPTELGMVSAAAYSFKSSFSYLA